LVSLARYMQSSLRLLRYHEATFALGLFLVVFSESTKQLLRAAVYCYYNQLDTKHIARMAKVNVLSEDFRSNWRFLDDLRSSEGGYNVYWLHLLLVYHQLDSSHVPAPRSSYSPYVVVSLSNAGLAYTRQSDPRAHQQLGVSRVCDHVDSDDNPIASL
jgi:hypothetical protein